MIGRWSGCLGIGRVMAMNGSTVITSVALITVIRTDAMTDGMTDGMIGGTIAATIAGRGI